MNRVRFFWLVLMFNVYVFWLLLKWNYVIFWFNDNKLNIVCIY